MAALEVCVVSSEMAGAVGAILVVVVVMVVIVVVMVVVGAGKTQDWAPKD